MKIKLKNKREVMFNKYLIKVIKNHKQDHPVLPSYISANGTLYWSKSGTIHRKVKPAVIFSNGEKRYWENGILIS